jgi:hypothetical protein
MRRIAFPMEGVDEITNDAGQGNTSMKESADARSDESQGE